MISISLSAATQATPTPVDRTIITTQTSAVVATGTNFFFGTQDLIDLAAALGITITDPIPDTIPPTTPTTREIVFNGTVIPVGALVGFNPTRIQFGDDSAGGDRLEFQLTGVNRPIRYTAAGGAITSADPAGSTGADGGGFIQAIYNSDGELASNDQMDNIIATYARDIGVGAPSIQFSPRVGSPVADNTTFQNFNTSAFLIIVNT